MANMTFKTNLLPNSTSGEYSLGSSEQYWNIYGKVNNLNIHYGVCETSAATATKAVTCDTFSADDLTTGAIVYVTFTNTNTTTASNLTLSVNGTTAKPIKYQYNASATSSLPGAGYLIANQTYAFTYNGTNWVTRDMHYNTDTNTLMRTYSNKANVELPIPGVSTTASSASAAWATTSTYRNAYGAYPSTNTPTINPSNGIITVPNGVKTDTILAPTTSNGTTYGIGTSGQALVSNGSAMYWGDVTPPFGDSSPASLGTATAGTSTAVSRSDHVHPLPNVSELNNDANYMSGMTILTYNSSTWDDFITAYNAKHLVYCRSAATGSPRMAFMAYVAYSNDKISNVEFQYYRSRQNTNYTTAIQGDQVCVYKLEAPTSSYPNGKWTLTTRNAYVSIQPGTGLSATTSTGSIDSVVTTKLTLENTGVTSLNGSSGDITLSNLTIGITSGAKVYNGTSAIVIEPKDLGLTGSMRFIGVVTDSITDGASTPTTLNKVDGTTVTQLENGDVILSSVNGEEYLWDGSKWNALGLATSYAIKNHIHGNINANGTLSAVTTSPTANKLVLMDTTNTIIGSNIQFTGNNASASYLQDNGSWGGIATTGTPGLMSSAQVTTLEEVSATYLPLAGGTMSGAVTLHGHNGTLGYDYGTTLPEAPTTGQIFFQIQENPIYEIPSGGTTGQVLMKASNTDRDLAWGNFVKTSGDTMTGNLIISKSVPQILVRDTANNNLTASLIVGSEHQNHGLYSNGYAPTSSTFTSSAKWIIYRAADGEAHSDLKIYGAVWNDYAEYRKDNPKESELQKPGRCVRELGNGQLTLTTERLQRGCEIISDTYGFAIGRDMSNGYNTPIASNGRVLAYILEGREEAKKHIGYPVCSGPNGTVSIMTHLEEVEHPSCIIGTISEVPDYEEWGTGKVKVNNRVWIRVR